MTLTLTPETAYIFILVFARLGSMISAMPSLGEAVISSQVRLATALLVTLVMLPVVGGNYGAIPNSLAGLAFAVLGEVAVGLVIGVSARMLTSALQVAGTVIAFQTGLAFAQNVDPTQGVQSALVASFLSMLAATLVFTTNLHHLLFAAMRDSYLMFKPGEALPIGDFAQMFVGNMSLVSGGFEALELRCHSLHRGLGLGSQNQSGNRKIPEVCIRLTSFHWLTPCRREGEHSAHLVRSFHGEAKYECAAEATSPREPGSAEALINHILPRSK
jgi:flagellar biosynthetic protein FliR